MTVFYHPQPSQPSCATAWLRAAEHLAEHGATYDLTLHIENPVTHSEHDNAIITEVDTLLKSYNAYGVSTVAIV